MIYGNEAIAIERPPEKSNVAKAVERIQTPEMGLLEKSEVLDGAVAWTGLDADLNTSPP
jgi:hypothetical protein